MLSPPRRQRLLGGLLFVALLLNGCAGTTALPTTTATSAPADRQQNEISASQLAKQALAAADYQQAADHFRMALANEEIADGDQYNFAKALYQSGSYAPAIEIYNLYLDKLGRKGAFFLNALEERNSAEEKLQQQKTAAAKAEQAAKALRNVARKLEENWLFVQQQVAGRAAAFKEPLTGMEMLLVPGGCYQMGDQFGGGEADELPVHRVCVDAYYLGRYEVTQAQWQQLMGYNPAQSNQGNLFPVESISWAEAAEFARKLGGAAGGYRLPTEAEWEYAARSGGEQQQYSGGELVDELAWHEDNSAGNSHPVGQKRPNGLGFYDMSGNLYEWCLDRYADNYYATSPQRNPTGAAAGSLRTRRGGSWDSRVSYSRTSYRSERHETDYRADQTGFRLALPVTDQPFSP